MNVSSTPAIVLRDARASDLPAIVAIERASFSDPWSARSFGSVLGRPEAIFQVAERRSATRSGADEIVGYFVAYTAHDQAELANIAVAASARREGVGRRLVEAVIAAVQGRGVLELFLEVRVSNVAARALYASLGFAEVGKRLRYYDHPVEDGLVLRRAIG